MSEEILTAADLPSAIKGIGGVSTVSAEEQDAIKRNTAYALPDSPVEYGMRADTVKPAFWRGIVGGSNSAIAFLNRLATETDGNFEVVRAVLLTLASLCESMKQKGDEQGETLDEHGNTLEEYGASLASLLAIGDATSDARGYMTPAQVKALTDLTDIFEDVDDSNTTVDTIRDVLAAFNEFSEGTEVAKLFTDLQTTDDELEGSINGLDAKFASKTAELKVADAQLTQAHGTLATRLDLAEKKIAILNGLTDFVVDDTVAYRKIVPPAALPYATVDKIGGAFGEVWPTNVFAKYGELVFDNYTPLTRDDSDPSKATIYIRGGSDGSYFYGIIATLDLPLGKKFTLSVDHNVGRSYVQLGWDDEAKEENGIYNIKTNGDNGLVMVYFEVNTPSSVNGTITITLNEGDVALPHEPSVADSVFVPVTKVVSESGNLFDIDNPVIAFRSVWDEPFAPKIENGVLYSGGQKGNQQGGGIVINVNGVDTVYISYEAEYADTEIDRYMVVCGIIGYDSQGYAEVDVTDSVTRTPMKKTSFSVNVARYSEIMITAHSNTQYGMALKNIMVSAADVPYQPYGVLDTFPIPAEVQELRGYGEANPENASEYNYIDFEAKKFVSYGHMNNGAWVAYTEPQETDVSEHLPADNFIKVGGAGTLTFVNEYGIAVPSTVTYQQEVTE